MGENYISAVGSWLKNSIWKPIEEAFTPAPKAVTVDATTGLAPASPETVRAENSNWHQLAFGGYSGYGCGGDTGDGPLTNKLKTDNGINITPKPDASGDVSGETDATEPEGVLPLPYGDFVSGAGERYEGISITTFTGNLYSEGLRDLDNLTILVETDPKKLAAAGKYPNVPADYNWAVFGCPTGMVNVTTNDPVNELTLPIKIVGYTIIDNLTGKEYKGVVNLPVEAVCMDANNTDILDQSADPVGIIVPKQVYNGNRIDITVKLNLEVDGTNNSGGMSYNTYVRLRMVANGN